MRKLWMSVGVMGCLTALVGCGPASNIASVSEVAASVVSGAVNSGNPLVGMNLKTKKSPVQRVIDALAPVGTAWAATWSCSGGSLSPAFAGPGAYSWTPVSCSVTWDNGKSASSSWSGVFDLSYGASCTGSSPLMESQAANCALTRTTATGGATRTIVGPNGGSYAIVHDTNGAGTGYDSSVSPAPSNAGEILTCGASGCSGGKNLVISGTHLHGTFTPAGGSEEKVWDHTVSTSAAGLTVTGSGTGRTVDGALTVQHNLAKYTANVTFNQVTYGEAGCCFPTSGSITAVFTEQSKSKTETLTFSQTCGEETLTNADGQTKSLTLQHCL